MTNYLPDEDANAVSMSNYVGSSQKIYELEDTPFKSGGEGSIYNIRNEPGLVAKIYKADKLNHELEEKIQAMVATIPKLNKNFLSMCAWPQDALYDAQHHFAGFVMARISGQEPLRYVFTYEDRTAPWSCYVHIAKNLAAAVHNIHAIGQVIGDLNPENILVDIRTGHLILIDTASFHIRTSPTTGLSCKVGMPRYIAPELQGKSLDSISFDQSFSQDSDNFSLAILIFQILMNGVHPFTCRVTSEVSASAFLPVNNIQNGLCPYFIKTNQTDILPYAPGIQCLPPEIQTLFRRAFVDGHKNPAARPHADEWYRALDNLSGQLKTCVKNPDHIYYRNATVCPWCDVEQKMMGPDEDANAVSMSNYVGSSQKIYELEETPFKSGGEGSIYNIRNEPGLVAKIYKADKLSHELEEKIRAMVATIPKLNKNFLSMCAWPQDALYDAQHHFAGFVMARISGQEPLRYVFTYGDRTAPWSCYVHIAKNLAAAVHNIHAIGQVIGDLNPGNILVDIRTGLLTLIDTASFHVRTSPTTGLRCKVGMPRYIAPELQGKSFDSISFDQSFSQDSDNFSLAILIFQILMNGAHPFACGVISDVSASAFQPVNNIQNGLCPYFIKTNQTDIPPYAPGIQCLPPEIQTLFRRAFVDGHKNPAARPHANEWYWALDNLSGQLKTCVKNPDHIYYQNAVICPWCEVEQKMAIPPPLPPPPPPEIVTKPPSIPALSSFQKGLRVACGVIIVLLVLVVASAMTTNLEVSSTPGGASVYLDGVYQGTTPMTIHNLVLSSEHSLRFSKEGYADYDIDPVKLQGGLGVSDKRSVTLTPLGYMSITSAPTGGSVYVDGVYEGNTPLKMGLAPGTYRVSVMKSDYTTKGSKLITVTAGSTVSGAFGLSPLSGAVDVALMKDVPTGGGYRDVTIRIANYGSTSKTGTVTVATTGGSETSFTITLGPNKSTTKTINIYWPTGDGLGYHWSEI